MDDELERMSTAAIVDIIKNKPLEFQSVSLSSVLAQLIRRSVIALQEEKAGARKSENELSVLYDEWLCTWILGILTSTDISTRALAGATYFLALSTAGGSSHADKFRSKLVDVRGMPKLVALLSYQSVSVRYNALLAFGNLLRHCPATHSQALRLGALRKLALLFQEAQEEPQQNLCIDTLLCFCDSNLPGMFYELQHNGLVNHLLDWVQNTTSERVCKKVIDSINILLNKSPESRNGLLQLHLVEPLLSVIRSSPYNELRLVVLTALECACCKEDSGMQRFLFIYNGGVKTLMQIIESKDIPLLVQAIQMLALLAILDEKARQEITAMSSCVQLLGNILHSSSLEYEAFLIIYGTKDNEEPELVPLLKEHVTAIRFLFKVCSVKFQVHQEHHAFSPEIIALPGIMAGSVGAE